MTRNRAVVLSWSQFLPPPPPGDIGQCLETFLDVRTWSGVLPGLLLSILQCRGYPCPVKTYPGFQNVSSDEVGNPAVAVLKAD